MNALVKDYRRSVMKAFTRRSQPCWEIRRDFLEEVMLELRRKVGIDYAEKTQKIIQGKMCKDSVVRESMKKVKGRRKA